MKRLFVLAVLLSPALAFGQYMVSDPTVVVSSDPANPVDMTKVTCAWQEGNAAPVYTPLVNDGCHVDLKPLPNGKHDWQVWFRWVDPINWPSTPEVVSAKVPFSFTTPVAFPPSSISAPLKLRLESK